MIDFVQRLKVHPFRNTVWIGAYCGVSLQMLTASATETRFLWNELWALPAVLAAYGLTAMPFVAIGLAVFGLPATAFLKPYRNRVWVGLVAVIWGAITGKLFYLGIDQLIFFGYYEFSSPSLSDLGLLYGMPTGVAWWWLKREPASNAEPEFVT